METVTEMTDERLALSRKLATTTRKRQASGYKVPIHTALLADAVDDNDRLRAELAAAKAENERLRIALTEIESGEDTNCRFHRLPGSSIRHNKGCYIVKAYRALNPEPAP